MTLQLLDGFDHLTAAGMTAKGWSFNSGSNTFSETVVAGRLSGNAYQMTHIGNAGDGTKTKNLPSTLTSLVCGCAIQLNKLPVAGNNEHLTLQAGGTKVLRVQFTTTGALRFLNSGGTVLATSSLTISPNVWNYIEVKITINGASSTLQTQANGGPDVGSTTVNLGSSGITNVMLGQLSIGPADVSNAVLWDDLYITNQSAPNGDFLSDCHVTTLYPTADGHYAQWTPNSGSNQFSRVNEHPPDGDTSYVSDNAIGDKDTFAVTTIAGGSIRGVQTNLYARKEDAGFRQVAPIIRVASTDYQGTSETLTTSYVDGTQLYDQNPGTSTTWTVSDINAAEFGMVVA
jgi:hypothetical protein